MPARRSRLLAAASTLHVYNVHLGTAVLERRYQATRLAAFVHDRRVAGPKIILGDFNEWMRGLATKTLSALFESIDIYAAPETPPHVPGDLPRPPSRSHLLRRTGRGPRLELTRSRMALMASDHLPLVADLRIGF